MTAAAGAVLVLSATILALRRYYARQRRCRDLLWSFAAALGEMESAIRWQRTPVLPLLEMLQTRELLRSANPQVIAVDEITEAADILAMTAAANCGVKLLATIHAEDGEELRRKPLFRQLAEAGVFRRLITISTAEGRRQYRTEAL